MTPNPHLVSAFMVTALAVRDFFEQQGMRISERDSKDLSLAIFRELRNNNYFLKTYKDNAA